MQALRLPRLSRLLTPIVPVLILTACGQGDGPQSIQNRPVTPLPPIPVGFCDPVNFEILCPEVGIINFNGGATTLEDNPVSGGINTSERVARMQKFPDQVFGGTRLDLDGPIDFSAGEAFLVKVWADRGVPLTFKLEQQNKERVGSHTGSGMWEEMCFDFSGDTAGVPNESLTLIFDNGVLGQADTDPMNWTFYYDDIEQVASCPTSGLPATYSTITFDDMSLTYTLTGFEGAEDSQVVADPDDAMNQAVRVNRSDSAQTFAGTTVSLGPNQAVPNIPLDTANPLMNVRVRAPGMNIPVRLKIENAADSDVAVETEALTTMTDTWETLTFDFSMQAAGTTAFDPAATYNKITIFFNFGTDGATSGAQTFYFDDIAVGAGSGGGGGGGGASDHGPGTAGVFTETMTESTITVTSITNSADFNGNNTVADPMSMAIPAFEGSVSLSIDYQDSGSNFGGALLNFGGVDLTAFDTLNITIDTSGIANLANLTLQLEPPGAGMPGTNVFLANYAPVATSGNWQSYQIPLADFTATNFTAVDNLGIWNPRDGSDTLLFGTLYVDDVYFSTEGGSGGGGGGTSDHGPGTASVFTETTTESMISVVGFINSADFGGNNTIADPMSTAIPAFEGSVSLSIDYQDSGSDFGGALLDFGGVDISAYDTLNLTIDSSAIANFADLIIQIEPPGAGAAGTNVAISAYTPVATSGNWRSYQIPLADFTATDLTAAANLGIWNARDAGGALVFGTLYVDDIYFSTENAGGGGGGGGAGGNLATNGDLETGDETGWTNFDNDGTVMVSTDNPSSGTYSLNLNIAYAGGGAPAPAAPTAKFERIGVGTVQPNQALTISFDIRATITQPGAALSIQFFTETTAGPLSSQEFLGGGPVTASIPDWETRTYNVTTGADASGGITLQFDAACGNVDGCAQDIYIDNVSITID